MDNVSAYSIKISNVDENEKFQKVASVSPNIIFNRLDIKYGKNFQLLEVQYQNKTVYVSYYMRFFRCHLGLYMVDIPQAVFDAVLSYLDKKYLILKFKISHSVNVHQSLKKTVLWQIKLPDTAEEYQKLFSSKTRYNRRYYKKKLEERCSFRYQYFDKSQLNMSIVKKFYELKKSKKKNYSKKKMKKLLTNSCYITDTYALYLNDKIAAIVMYSIIDGVDAYCYNMTYDMNYSHYAIGNLLFYHSVEDLISKGVKSICLGGGKYEYKKNAKAEMTNTYSGVIKNASAWDLIKKFVLNKLLLFR